MAIVFEFIFQLLLELLLQIAIEVLVHLGWGSIAETLEHKSVRNPYLAFMGHGLLGLASGGLSLLVFPELFIHNTTLRIANLILAPVLAGFFMSALGAWRERRGFTTIKLDSFAYGFIFAFGLALIRYSFGAK